MPGNGHTERPDDIRQNGHRRGSKKEQAECKRNKVNEKKEQVKYKRNKVKYKRNKVKYKRNKVNEKRNRLNVNRRRERKKNALTEVSAFRREPCPTSL